MFFIGDVHANLTEYLRIVESLDGPSIQVGDMGFGFFKNGDSLPEMSQHRFLRGNHDHPGLAKAHPGYLGDYGYLQDSDIFFVSGAPSVDQEWRTRNINWWPEEELAYEQLMNMISLVSEKRPRVIVSHECPVDFATELLEYRTPTRSRTGAALGGAFEQHQPELWVFGHHHRSVRKRIGGTMFVGLDILEVFRLSP